MNNLINGYTAEQASICNENTVCIENSKIINS